MLAARGARALRDRHGFHPDIVIGHPGWGETLFLKEIWPHARLLVYAELMYRTRGHDVGFDPEISPDRDEVRFMTVARSAHLVQAMVQADAAIALYRDLSSGPQAAAAAHGLGLKRLSAPLAREP